MIREKDYKIFIFLIPRQLAAGLPIRTPSPELALGLDTFYFCCYHRYCLTQFAIAECGKQREGVGGTENR